MAGEDGLITDENAETDPRPHSSERPTPSPPIGIDLGAARQPRAGAERGTLDQRHDPVLVVLEIRKVAVPPRQKRRIHGDRITVFRHGLADPAEDDRSRPPLRQCQDPLL